MTETDKSEVTKSNVKLEETEQEIKEENVVEPEKVENEVKTVERRPLYEPKTKIKLPPRKKTKIQRWPVINLPPLKKRKVKEDVKEKPKPEILKRKKPNIEYPPLKFKKPKPEPEKEKKPKLTRLQKTHFPIRPSTLEKVWNNFKFRDGKFILRGQYSTSHKRFSDYKMTSATSISCLALTHLTEIRTWLSSDIDKIWTIAANLYKESLQKLKKKEKIDLRPDQILPVMYVDLQKLSINVDKSLQTICLGKNPLEDIEKGLKEMLESSKKCILSYGDKNYAIWEEDSAFYVFIQEDCDEKGVLVEKWKGQCCILRFTEFTKFIEYLREILKTITDVVVCRIFSFQVMKVTEMQRKPDKKLLEEPQKVIRTRTATIKDESEESIKIEEVIDESFSVKLEKHLKKIQLSKDFKAISDNCGILRSMIFNECPSRTSALVVACLLMLKKPTVSWTNETLNDIFTLADSILEENSTATSISDFKEVFFDNKFYSIKTSNVTFGQIESKENNLSSAVRHFFKEIDVGVIQGPHVIPIWHENELFFMFDPKERDSEGRKFIKNAFCDASHGSSCVMWFKNLSDLIETYKSNVAKNHLRDLFKIIKVDIRVKHQKLVDWFSFQALNTEKWILRASFDETNERFFPENRGKQGVCMAATAIGFAGIHEMTKWKTKTLDKILKIGDEFHSLNLVKLKTSNKYVSSLLNVEEIERQIKINDKTVKLKVGETLNGSLLEKEADKNLQGVFEKFFETRNSGIFIACQTAIAIFRVGNEFFVFDPHQRDENGRNLDTKVSNKTVRGLACCLRFSSLNAMISSLSTQFLIKDSPEFSITHVAINNQDLKKGKPDLKSYSDFLNYRFAGILRENSNFHEDSSAFPIKSIKKTYCNLLVAMAMSQIIPSIDWNSKDLHEILTIGYQIFLEMPKNVSKLTKVHFLNENFEISSETEQCVFGIDERVTTEEVAEEVIELNPSDVVDENGENQQSETKSEEKDDPLPVFAESSNELTSSMTLQAKIESLSHENEAFSIIESPIFTLALWKQDDFYFIFDPKDTKSDGTFTESRLDEVKTLLDKKKFASKTTEIRKKQVETIERSEIEVVDDELKKFIVPEANLSIMYLPERSFHTKNTENSLGSSVIVFSYEVPLMKHLLSNIPEENRFDEFTWHSMKIRKEFKIKDETLNCKDWNHFMCHKNNRHWILRGTTSQKEDRFNYENSQDICNCLVALSIASNIAPQDWNPTMIDVALKYGTRLYSSSLYQIRKSDSRLSTVTRLGIDQMINSFVIIKTRFGIKFQEFKPELFETVDEENSSEETKTEEKSKENTKNPEKLFPIFTNLKKFLENFFTETTFGVLIAKKYAVAILKDAENAFYLFDPHNTGPNGVRNSSGVASLNRFLSLDDLSTNFLLSIEDLEGGTNTFDIYKIKVESSETKPSKNKQRKSNQSLKHFNISLE